MDSKQNPTTELLNILTRAMDANVYGSIEIYLEDGQITQITERRIKKIKKTSTITKPSAKTAKSAKQVKKSVPSPSKNTDPRVKYQN